MNQIQSKYSLTSLLIAMDIIRDKYWRIICEKAKMVSKLISTGSKHFVSWSENIDFYINSRQIQWELCQIDTKILSLLLVDQHFVISINNRIFHESCSTLKRLWLLPNLVLQVVRTIILVFSFSKFYYKMNYTVAIWNLSKTNSCQNIALMIKWTSPLFKH